MRRCAASETRSEISNHPASNEVNLATAARAIETAYDRLAEAGEGALNADPSDQFLAHDEILAYGYRKFVQIEPTTPPARLFDKAAWVVGQSAEWPLHEKEGWR